MKKRTECSTNAELMRKSIKERGFTVPQAAWLIGMDAKSFCRKMSGESEFTASEMRRWCEVFGSSCAGDIFFAKRVDK